VSDSGPHSKAQKEKHSQQPPINKKNDIQLEARKKPKYIKNDIIKQGIKTN